MGRRVPAPRILVGVMERGGGDGSEDAGAARKGARRAVRAFAHRDFRLYISGQMVSLVGTWMQSVAQGWLVWRLTHSTAMLGVVGFCQMGPMLAFGLIGGLAADRFDRRRIVIATQSVMLVQATLLAALTLGGVVRPWHVLVLATLLGVANAFDMPGRQSFIVHLVGRDDLPNAIAINSSVFNSARIVGPAVAGLVVARWGEGVCFAVNAVSYVAVIAGLLALRVRPTPRAAGPGNALGELREGFAYAWNARHARWLLVLLAAAGFFGMSYSAFMPAFAGEVLGGGPHELGMLLTATGLGALVAASFLAGHSELPFLARLAPYCVPFFGAMLIVFAAVRSLAAALFASALVAVGMITQLFLTNTLLQSLVPDRLRGRVVSIYSVTFGGFAPLGSLALGQVAHVLPLQTVVAAGGAAAAAIGLVLARPLSDAVRAAVEARVPGRAAEPEVR